MNAKHRTAEPAIRIKNRDIPRLQKVVSLMQDIRVLEERRLWMRDRMTNISLHLSGMPGSGQPRGLDAAYAALSELESEHQELVKNYVRELKAAERMINSISNPCMRTFVTLMYMLDMDSRDVKAELNMTEWGFRRARTAVEQADGMDRVVWRERYIFAKTPE